MTKKINLFLLSLLLVLPLAVKAAEKPAVKTLEAKVDGTSIKYNGTMETGSVAVMCKLYSEEDVEVDIQSTAVSSLAFEDSFVALPAGKYYVVCANYDGGSTKKSEIVEVTKLAPVPTGNPDTYDAGIRNSVILLTISAIAIAGYVIYLKKKEI